MSEVTDLIKEHHREIASRLGATADGVQAGGDGVDALLAFLHDDLLPHARGEERHLYVAIDDLAKGALQVTASMRIDHEHIERYARAIELTAGRLRAPTDAADATAAAALLLDLVTRLQALVEVHLEKEERVYLPFLERTMSLDAQRTLLAEIHETAASASDAIELDARAIPHQERHRRIFAAFDALGMGESFVLVNDHDPRPLRRHFEMTHPGGFTWEYLSQGPEWRIRISRATTEAAGASVRASRATAAGWRVRSRRRACSPTGRRSAS